MKVKIKNARCSFPDLFNTSKFEGVDTEKYGITLILNKTEHADAIKEIKDACQKLIVEKLEQNKLPREKICLRDGDEMEHDYYADSYIIRPKTKKSPLPADTNFSIVKHFLVMDKNKSILTAENNKFYGGCYVNACIDIYASKKYKLILASLLGVQFHADGEPLGEITQFGFDDFDSNESSSVKDASDDFF